MSDEQPQAIVVNELQRELVVTSNPVPVLCVAQPGTHLLIDRGVSPSALLLGDQKVQGFVVEKSDAQVIVAGFKGDKGADGEGGTTFVFNQPTATTNWHIVHNLGRYPSVDVVDSANNLAMGAVTYTDENTIDLYFSAPFAGSAFLN